MCELFGFHSPRAQDVRGFLTEFYSHSARHSHGWGFASLRENEWQVVTEPVCANKSELASDEMQGLPPQKLMIGHIRLASIGGIQKENCHPFTRTDMTNDGLTRCPVNFPQRTRMHMALRLTGWKCSFSMKIPV